MSDHADVLQPFVGQTLVGFTQESYSEGSGWHDDEPLELTFGDGSVLVISVGGWHGSGVLYLGAESPQQQDSGG